MGKNDVAPARSAGEQEAGSQPGKELHFDSKKIDQKQKPEYFVKVEGAEERKKAVVRKLKEQKEQLAKQAKQNKRDAKLEAFKQAHRSRFAKIKSAVGNFLKKHKLPLLIIAVALLVALAGWMVYRALNPPLTEDEQSSLEYYDTWRQINQETSTKFEDVAVEDNISYEEALGWYVEQAESAEDEDVKFGYYSGAVGYALKNGATNDARIYVDIMEQMAKNSEQLYSTYAHKATIYYMEGDDISAREYEEKAAAMSANLWGVRSE